MIHGAPVITLKSAAKKIYVGFSNLKTITRRLYDISNALTCLNLIAKTNVGGKLAFIWKGPQGIDSVTPRTEPKNEEKGAENAEIIHSVETKNEEIVNKVFK